MHAPDARFLNAAASQFGLCVGCVFEFSEHARPEFDSVDRMHFLGAFLGRCVCLGHAWVMCCII